MYYIITSTNTYHEMTLYLWTITLYNATILMLGKNKTTIKN